LVAERQTVAAWNSNIVDDFSQRKKRFLEVESYGDKRSCIELAVPTGDGANARIGQ
jgi:hypothetical protein